MWPSALFFLLLTTVSVAYTACAPEPVHLRMGNVSLPNGQVARGMEMHVGTPPQPMAVLPFWPFDSFMIWGRNGYCIQHDWTQAGCTTVRGGAYEPITSSTTQPGDPRNYVDEARLPQTSLVADTLQINANLSFKSFPLRVAMADWFPNRENPLNMVGLGPNSTIMNLLLSAGRIRSRSWGYFWGRGFGQSPQLDGGFVFGGYDRAKTLGQKFTLPMSPASETDCISRLMVPVANILLNFNNGSDFSIFPRDQTGPLRICLVPSLPALMQLPLNPYFANWLSAFDTNIFALTRTADYYFYNMRFQPGQKPYDGAVTFVLDGGFKVRLENDQIVVPHVGIDTATGATTTNATGPDFLINSLQAENSKAQPNLGMQFVSAAYLFVEQDRNQFSLWNANPTPKVDLVAVDTEGNEETEFCPASPSDGRTGADPSAPATLPTGSNSAAASPSHGPPLLSTAAIAGIAAGTVALLLALVAAAFFWKRRRARFQKRPSPQGYQRGELHAEEYRPGELGTCPRVEEMGADREPKELSHEAVAAASPYEPWPQPGAYHHQNSVPVELDAGYSRA